LSPLFLIIIPGMISRVLYTGKISVTLTTTWLISTPPTTPQPPPPPSQLPVPPAKHSTLVWSLSTNQHACMVHWKIHVPVVHTWYNEGLFPMLM
jgi:hypothetical protein